MDFVIIFGAMWMRISLTFTATECINLGSISVNDAAKVYVASVQNFEGRPSGRHAWQD